MKEVNIKLYQYEELSAEAKKNALETCRDFNVTFDCWDEYTLEEFKAFLEMIGFVNPKIAYSGFWSQGDGLSFTGVYGYKKDWKKNVKENYPDFLEKFAVPLKDIQQTQHLAKYRAYGYLLKQGYRYSHSNTVAFTMEDNEEYSVSIEEHLQDAFRGIMNIMYALLEKEYENQKTDEAVEEAIVANEIWFTEDGKTRQGEIKV